MSTDDDGAFIIDRGIHTSIVARTALALSVVLALSGCAYYEDRLPAASPEQITSSVSYTVHGDTECLPPVRAAVEQRAREWGSVSRGHIAFRFAWDLSPQSLLRFSDEPLILCWPGMRHPNTGVELCGATTASIIYISTTPACDTSATALHELGHLAGVPDSSDPLAVMHPSSRATRLTAADVRACADVGLCPHPGRAKDITTVTVTVDPNMPNPSLEYP